MLSFRKLRQSRDNCIKWTLRNQLKFEPTLFRVILKERLSLILSFHIFINQSDNDIIYNFGEKITENFQNIYLNNS